MRFLGLSRVHFVGIGGIGMSGIAEVLLTLGFTVTGSDIRESDTTARLASRGAGIFIGHGAENVGDAQVVVFSSAVRRDNPEVGRALSLGIPVIPRAEMLAELMRMKTSVTVAGSHGKTTVTAMLAHLAQEAGLDPTAVIGGKLSTFGASARLGRSDLMVVEADESDRSFLLLQPTLAVITNIDWEHVDCYPTLQDLRDAFLQFAEKVPFFGACVVCADDPNIRLLIPRMNRRVVTYGMDEPADFQAVRLDAPEGRGERFEARFRGEPMGEVTIRQEGRHNILNATAALAAAHEIGVRFDTSRRGLASFPGADRRFQLKGAARGIRVIDDYGHHPTEIAATLEAGRRVAGAGRLVVLFQPHRFSRLQAFEGEFARVLAKADAVIVTEVYPAGETPIPGVTSEALAEGIRKLGGDARVCPGVQDLPSFVAPGLRPGDLVLTMGAGSITTVGPHLLNLLGGDRGA